MFQFNFLSNIYGEKSEKRVVKALEIKQFIKNNNKIKNIQNILLSPNAKTMLKIMVRKFKNFH